MNPDPSSPIECHGRCEDTWMCPCSLTSTFKVVRLYILKPHHLHSSSRRHKWKPTGRIILLIHNTALTWDRLDYFLVPRRGSRRLWCGREEERSLGREMRGGRSWRIGGLRGRDGRFVNWIPEGLAISVVFRWGFCGNDSEFISNPCLCLHEREMRSESCTSTMKWLHR